MLSLAFQNRKSAAAVLSTAASLAASAMLIRSIANDLLPNEVHDYFSSTLHNLSRYFSSQLTIVIDEFQGLSMNKLFEAADVYLGTRMTPSVRKIRVVKGDEEKKLAVTMDRNEEIVDVFENVRVKWTMVCRQARAIKEENKVVKLHTVNYSNWDLGSILLDHPMTFQTLAMDSELKKELVEDLDNFVNGKDYYRRIGKAWKRGYLLYGPPGTGKSSLIAAMANHLNYDIYDLDLTNVNSNSDLRALLLAMSSKSILVIEDIDCMIKLQNRDSEERWQPHKNQVTLSGLLNFIDGIWSCCGDQGRIIVFSTNHRDQLDPALLRPGRMDMHIHMSYCTISAFKQLALNYLGVWQHPLFDQVEGLMGEVKVTPAEVAGELIKSKDPDVSLQGLLGFLHSKNEAKPQKEMEAEDRSD
uniref:AAA+ ATPase domain-containing protein n=1 Tax=Vitis vinifera TaxID=29760 RepID=F6GYL6_VITVI